MVENPLEQIEFLKKVQSIDSQIQEMERAKGDIPERLSELEAERERDRADIYGAKEHLVKLEQEVKRLEKEIAFDRETYANFETKSKEVKSNEAYQAALRELENRKKIIRGKEEEVLRLMEEAETIKKKISQLEEDFKEIGKKYEEQEGELKRRVSEIEEESKDLRTERGNLSSNVDKGLLSKYEQIFQRKDGLAVVAVVEEVCQGCFMGVPPQIVNDARAGKNGVQVCANCHRVIFWAPADSPEDS